MHRSFTSPGRIVLIAAAALAPQLAGAQAEADTTAARKVFEGNI